MTPDELGRMLALVGAYLPSAVRARFFAVLPEALRNISLRQVDQVRDFARDQLSLVEQILLSDLEAHFGDGEVTAEINALPVRVADVLALVLRPVTVSQHADIVRRLPDGLQSEILHLIAAQNWAVWERRLGGAELEMMVALRDTLGLSDFEASPEFVSEILHHIQNPADVRRNLTYMYEKDPDSTGYIQNHLYGFESLVKLPDRELQRVLQRVDHWDLILAMRSAPANMRRKILGNLSERRAALFEDDETTLEEVDDAQVEMLQHQILDRARLSYEAGDLHTYLGSIAGQETDIDLAGTSDEIPLSVGKPYTQPNKKPEQRRYGVGGLLVLIVLGVGYGVVYWFGHSQSSQTASGHGKAIVADEEEDFEAVSPRKSKKAMGRSSQLGNAAILSGKALLMTGEAIRSLDENSLKSGDRIKTESDGRASVALSNDAGQLQVESETEVQIGQTDETTTGPPRLDLRVGNIWVEVQDPTLQVTSPLAEVTGSKGALYHLRVTLNATTILSVHGGTVWVQVRDGGGLHVLGIGERLRVETNGDVGRDRHTEVSKWIGTQE